MAKLELCSRTQQHRKHSADLILKCIDENWRDRRMELMLCEFD